MKKLMFLFVFCALLFSCKTSKKPNEPLNQESSSVQGTTQVKNSVNEDQNTEKYFTVESIASVKFFGNGGYVNGTQFSIQLVVNNNTSSKCNVKIRPQIYGKYKDNKEINIPESWLWDSSIGASSVGNINYSNWSSNENRTITIADDTYSFDFNRTPTELGLFVRMDIYSVDLEKKGYKLVYYDLLPLYMNKQKELGLR